MHLRNIRERWGLEPNQLKPLVRLYGTGILNILAEERGRFTLTGRARPGTIVGKGWHANRSRMIAAAANGDAEGVVRFASETLKKLAPYVEKDLPKGPYIIAEQQLRTVIEKPRHLIWAIQDLQEMKMRQRGLVRTIRWRLEQAIRHSFPKKPPRRQGRHPGK